jgi:hypothetical protein
LWASTQLQSNPNGSLNVPIAPSLTLKGDYFIVISQISSASSLRYAYEKVAPINFATFFVYYPNSGWIDLANADKPLSAYRIKVGVQYDSTTTVPVSFVQFSGERKSNNLNLLSWSSTNEINNAGFELQRSNDGKIFSAITFIPSKSQDNKAESIYHYSVTDKTTSNEIQYYRLKQIDKSGKYAFSQVIAIQQNKSTNFAITSIYPNPANKEISIKLTAPSASLTTNLRISDISGRTVLQQKLSIVAGENSFTVPVNMLKKGSYVLNIESKEGIKGVAKFEKE